MCTVRRACAFILPLIVACSTGQPPPDPASLLRDAGQAMGKLKTVSADVRFASGKVELQGFTLDSASTTVRLPSDSDTTFKVKQGDFLVNVRVLTTGGKVYIQLPFSSMQALTPAQAAEVPDLSALFDQQHGLPVVLGQGRKPALQGSEQVDGVQCYKVAATYTADQIGGLMSALKPASDIAATFWIGQSDHLVRRATLKGAFEQPNQVATVEVHLHDFDKPVDISPPAVSPAA
jgi:hypothetical protein